MEILKKTCQMLEIDIKEITNEIIELQLAREGLIDELRKKRRKLYRKVKKMEKRMSEKNAEMKVEESEL